MLPLPAGSTSARGRNPHFEKLLSCYLACEKLSKAIVQKEEQMHAYTKIIQLTRTLLLSFYLFLVGTWRKRTECIDLLEALLMSG